MYRCKKFMPLILLALTIVVEVFLWNFASVSSLFFQKNSLNTAGDYTGLIYDADLGCYKAPTGIFVWEGSNLNVSLQNLHVGVRSDASLSPANVDTLTCRIALRDEGNAYSYELPERTIVSGISATEYMALYPYGKVTDLQITFETAESAVIQWEEIAANVPVPFSIQPVRILLIYTLALLIWGILSEKALLMNPVKDHSRSQQIILILVLLLMLGLFYGLVGLSPTSVRPPWPHHNQYRELTELLLSGETVLAEKPGEDLLQSANPYDTIRLQALSIDYKADYAYYNGNYYIYFGVVPALLLYIPCYLLTGHHLPDYLAVWACVGMFAIMVFALYREVIRRWFPKTPFIFYIMISVLTIFNGGYVCAIAQPSLYDVPIMMANMFIAAGLYFWLQGIRSEKGVLKQCLFFTTGSLSMALVAGCRPQMLLFSFLALPLFWNSIFSERTLFSKTSVRQTIAICLPYLLVAAGIMYYNYIRFDSPFDFGAAYSLTSNDMTRRGFNMERIVLGLYHFFFQLPIIDPVFPFVQRNEIRTIYMGKMTAEYTYGGLLSSNAFLWVLPTLFWLRNRLKEKKLLAFTIISLGISILLAALDVNFAGILQRYFSDLAFGSLIAAAIAWFALFETEGADYKPSIARQLFCFCMVLQIIYSLCLIFGGNNTTYSLQNTNAQFYYQYASWF